MATRRKPMSEINVVPYIDVMLVLLVIFMATAPLLTQGVVVDLPEAPSEPIEEAQDDPLVVSMRADGAIFLNLGLQDADDAGTRVTVFSLEEQAGKILRARAEGLLPVVLVLLETQMPFQFFVLVQFFPNCLHHVIQAFHLVNLKTDSFFRRFILIPFS